MIKEDDTSEDASARAKQLTEALRGLLKEELREYGGAEAFVRWIRSDKDAALAEFSDSMGLATFHSTQAQSCRLADCGPRTN